MTALQKLKDICDSIGVKSMTADYADVNDSIPESYVVLVPIADELDEYADDFPTVERNSVRLSIYTKRNYTKLRKRIRDALIENGVQITGMSFIEKEQDTGYYHYEIDVEYIEFETEE